MKLKNLVPTEDQDCMALVIWMELHGLRFSHIPQETYTPHWGLKMKNKKKGVRKGVPDYIIFPRPGCLLFIEMKRKGRDTNLSDIKPEQREWIDSLNTIPGVAAFVCFGYDQAVAVIEREMKR